MGASQSLDIPGGGYEGYHVIKVQENSPGSKAGLEPYFDYIIAAGNTRLNEINDDLRDILKSHIDKPLVLTVYNSKRQNVRSLNIVPTNNWNGQGLLGVSIRFASFENANENVWHILNISPASPAEKAGLISNTDYIVGADSFLQDNDDIFNLIKSYDGKELKLFVYNSQMDKCREVTIVPNSNWGGSGLLGCDIGYGYLHRIPKHDEQVSSNNFNAKLEDSNLKNNPVPTTIQHSSVTNISDITANTTQMLATPTAPPETNINTGISSSNLKISSPSGSLSIGDVSNSSINNQSNPLTSMSTVDPGVSLSFSTLNNDTLTTRYPISTSSTTVPGPMLTTSRPSLQAAPTPTVSFPPPMLSKPPSTFYFTPSPLYNNSTQQTSPVVSINPETVQTTIGNPNFQMPNIADLSLRPQFKSPPVASNYPNLYKNLAKNDSMQYSGNTFNVNNIPQSKLPPSTGTFSQPISSSNMNVPPPPPQAGFAPPRATNFSNIQNPSISQPSFSAPGTVPDAFKPIGSGGLNQQPFTNYVRPGGDASFPNITLYNPLNPPAPISSTTSSTVNTTFPSTTTSYDKSQPTSFSSLGPPPSATSMPPPPPFKN